MVLFTLGCIALLAGLVIAMFTTFGESRALSVISGALLGIVGAIMVFVSTAIYVEDNQGGIVINKFGPDLQSGRIIATSGEKGPQAKVLPPGWHFGFVPWKYELHSVNNIEIPQGSIGTVTAKDGKPLPDGEIFASVWTDPAEMLDGEKFLAGQGIRGPQLTILTPGQYRYNDRLFTITTSKMVEVPAGEVAVVKANAGPVWTGEVVEVNGTPIVPKGYRGIWNQVLPPSAYNLHPLAYVVTPFKTTTRSYDYSKDRAIETRTMDGFEFPVELRAAINITADNAPFVVARFGNPDADTDKNGSTLLEENAILPALRSIVRNTAEKRKALAYMNERSVVGTDCTKALSEALSEFKIDVAEVFIADIGLSKTEQGKELLETQTMKEIATQEKTMYAEQESAQKARAAVVTATTEAEQQAEVVKATVSVKTSDLEAQAAANRAKGEAAKVTAMSQAYGGPDMVLKMELAKLWTTAIQTKWSGNVPQIVVMGGGDKGGNLMDTWMATMVKQSADAIEKK